MSIYNCIISELQHFVAQPLILRILRAIKLHVHIRTIEDYSKCWISHIRSPILLYPSPICLYPTVFICTVVSSPSFLPLYWLQLSTGARLAASSPHTQSLPPSRPLYLQNRLIMCTHKEWTQRVKLNFLGFLQHTTLTLIIDLWCCTN